MEKLTKDQSTIGKAIERRVENYYKTSKTRKNLRYFRTQLELLDGEWSTFLKNHSDLQRLESTNSSHLYFTEDFFGQVKSAYDDFKAEIEYNITSLAKEEEQVLLGASEGEALTLKQMRTQKALIKSLERLLRDLEIDIEPVKSRAFCEQNLTDISHLWKSISEIHHCIMAEIETPEYDEEAYIQLEKRYKSMSIRLLDHLENHSQQADGAISANRQSFVRLPKISIPTFSGEYSKWKQFHDLFYNLVECQPMANSQKMFYLKSNLAGEAERIIQHLEISDANYNTAWKLLESRYDNKRLIVSSFLKSIFLIPISSFDTAQSLKRLHDIVQEALLGIKNQGLDTSNWDAMLLHLLLQKVDKETHRLFEQGLEHPREIPSLNIFLKFIEARFQLLETLGESKEESQSKQKKGSKYSLLTTNSVCELCKKYHIGIHQCAQFLKLTPAKRFEMAKKLQYCINCLKKGHSRRECKSQACHKCNKRHNTLLHFEAEIKKTVPKLNELNAVTEPPTVHTAITSTTDILTPNYVFLGTAIIIVKAKYGQSIKCRAILDSGSQLNFVTERLVQKLGLKGKQQKIQISGIGTSRFNSQGVLHLNINSGDAKFSANIEAVIIPEITSLQPSQTFNIESWPLPQNIKLADPEFYQSKTVDLLLGADIYSDLMSNGQIKMSANLPTLQNSVFGWVVLGRVGKTALEQSYFCGISTSSLDDHLQRFWNLEECHTSSRPMTTLERECDHYYNQNTRREITGRVVVKLPFKKEPDCLGNSREIAMRRFTQLEKRLDRDQKLKREYKHFMDELIQLQHMTPISFNEIPKNHYFMPHHCVIKPESTTTKLRVVFDASCKTSSNISLNDILQVGPTIQNDLFTILVRFRMHKYAFTADITKMYRQIQVTDDDQYFQLILWRENHIDPIQCYKLRTVTYGTACAPYLATKTLQYLSEQYESQYPLGAKIVKQDFYVDDLITGANNLSEAIQIQTEVRSLLQEAGMPLRKWCANHRELLKSVPSEDLETLTSFQNDGESYTKSLGLIWYPHSDSFAIKVKLTATKQVSKRTILADIAHIYDPLGLINPVISKAKIFIQELWQMKLDWDDQIPEDLAQKWQRFREELKSLSAIILPRHLFSRNITKSTQLHAFSDASERAYGVVVFIRSIDSRGTITVRLVCAKSRVAPIKVTTLPRLELCAAHLMVELVNKLKDTLRTDEIFFWTDSSITLSWIKSSSTSFKTFVANRVSYIQEKTVASQWRHVPTKQNPADLLSRGTTPKALLESEIWFHGPPFLLKSAEHWPNTNCPNIEIEEEKRPAKSSLIASASASSIIDSINHRNSFKHLQHVVAYVKRFAHNSRQMKEDRIMSITLSPRELQDAMYFLLREVQKNAFADEIRQIKKSQSVSTNNQLTALTPFICDNGLIRVGGRLHQSTLPYDAKHQILLPHSNEIVTLLARQLHEKNLHAGPQALLAIMRQRFWPLRGKSLAQSIVKSCIRCCKAKPKLLKQIMGTLPKERIQPARTFTNVGIDFCGPIYVHYRIRGKIPTKTYIAVFVCFGTKAVHLELVSDLTKDAFIGALRRFVARRGRPSKIFCDNATNFTGASNDLKELKTLLIDSETQDHIIKHCSEEFIEWQFIPPRSPHFGGLWEAAVKSAKHHLKRVIDSTSLTYEELHTIITGVEAILNSRPLTPLSHDPNDLQALTPGHFIIGEALNTIPNPEANDPNHKPRRRLEIMQACRAEFWKRWSKEYLQQLQIRTKWKSTSPPLPINTLVLIKEENVPPLKWPIGRIMEQHKGPDGRIRVVDIKTERGTIRRAIHNLCPLPIEDHSKVSSNEESSRSDGPNTSHTSLVALGNTSRKVKRKIYPINSNWLTSPALYHSSNQKCGPSESQDSSSERKRLKSSAPLTGSKLTQIAMALLVLFIPPLQTAPLEQSTNKVIELVPIERNTPLYFEHINQMSMAVDKWNIIVYYNLKNYWKESFTLKAQLKNLKEMCHQQFNGRYKNYCLATTAQLQQQLNTIENNNTILKDQNKNPARLKRSPFDIIGTIGNKLFGILDQEYADHVAETIDIVKQNENHLLNLIKNQTSIIDSTENLIKKDEETNNSHFSEIIGILNELHSELNTTNQVLSSQQTTQILNIRVTNLALIMSSYQQTQAALINIITDSQKGRINPLILTPTQLTKELRIIKDNIPAAVTIPGYGDHNTLIQVYNLMSVQSRVTEEAIIFKLNLPLLTSNIYQIFKVVPIPFEINATIVHIKGSSEFIAIPLQRDKYYLLSTDEITSCISMLDETLICTKKHAYFKKNTGPAKCEISLFNQETILPKTCELERLTNINTWIQLYNPNNWIYSIKKANLLVLCGKRTYNLILEGQGLLKFQDRCTIQQDDLTISSHYEHKSKVNQSYHQSITINITSIDDHLWHQEIHKAHNIVIKNNSATIHGLKAALKIVEQQQHLADTSKNEIHHFTISYFALIAAITSILIYIGRKYCTTHPNDKGREIPEPKPRRLHFQLNSRRREVFEIQQNSNERENVNSVNL